MKPIFKIIATFFFCSIIFIQKIICQGAKNAAVNINSGCRLTKDKMNLLDIELAANIDSLKKINALARPAAPGNTLANYPVMFNWPLRSRDAEDYAWWYISNYVDLDASSGLLDYNGGQRTYDSHNGCDIVVGPYWWKRKNDGDIYVIAAAHGVIVGKGDNLQTDDNCNTDTWQGNSAYGNYVVLLHDDNSTITYYAHMKQGSLTAKVVGDEVNVGEYLGQVASSGRSSAPHLHFEVHRNANVDNNYFGVLAEPFSTNTALTQWNNQIPYDNPTVMGIEIFTSTPDFYNSSCDLTVNLLNKAQVFAPGDQVHARTFFTDRFSPNNIVFSAYYRPDNTLAYSDQSSYTGVFAYGGYYYTLPADAPTGTWRFEVVYAGIKYVKFFNVGCVANIIAVGTHSGSVGRITSGTILSTATISGSSSNYVEYKADNYVQLNPGFTATAGCYFKADTKGCNTGN